MAKTNLNKNNIVDFILGMFVSSGAQEYIGEAVTVREHLEQSAACAKKDSASDELIIAALLHDIGHFVADFPVDALELGVNNLHEHAAADLLEAFYPAEVTEPIRQHVAAKKYLCAVDSSYIQHLSQASVNSLKVQGGPMNKAEVQAFESNPHHKDCVKLRHYDDNGKVEGLTIKPVTSYREKLEALLLP